ncbi:MAG: DUF1674 domain-containing protein [Rhodospirillaceae bacterium]|jgi:hypothetical protein|nr:DUF1674 domain-containing protein [Rhodospirillaceae bacterium]|tara:strand:+ start:936 stop:1112 length:177 start_codon:yes stop_codon:yes gene_type:complete
MSKTETAKPAEDEPAADAKTQPESAVASDQPSGEVGGPKGPEPTRYGDWAFNGRVSDF